MVAGRIPVVVAGVAGVDLRCALRVEDGRPAVGAIGAIGAVARPVKGLQDGLHHANFIVHDVT